jgi:FAD/FMN-containing dehydrogenase/Fe-S oxidoreductase
VNFELVRASNRSGGMSGQSRDLGLERCLRQAMRGEVKFDLFTRGRFATDASIYQIFPVGIVFPESADDVAAAISSARDQGVPVIMRGGGTSQNGQPIGSGLVIDCSRAFNSMIAYDPQAMTVTVQPGIVLEHLNNRLKADGLFFPVEPSTSSRCTIGGMTGNNSCGARSIRYGKMVDNVLSVDALLASGEAIHFGMGQKQGEANALTQKMLRLAERERAEIIARYPKVQRRVGGYNLDSLILPDPNPAHLLVGSEGTLAAFTSVSLKLSKLPAHRVMGVCHFPSFRSAMETTQHIVALGPVAVELVDNNVLVLGADIPLFKRTLEDITRGQPNCLLLVEFAGDDLNSLKHDLKRLDQFMADCGFQNAVVEVVEPPRQRQVWEAREACLNIMMSMKGDEKPVSFIEDCAVPLDRLADYTDAVTDVFAKHGARGTWYAHASVGCLHVRPILNMKTEAGIKTMRGIAEETAALVKRFEGSYSGEHGDGISRSEFIEPLFGSRLTRAFEEVKLAFDSQNHLNPGKIVSPIKFDDRSVMRYGPDYAAPPLALKGLNWIEEGSFSQAAELCNNNGTCRKLNGGSMCPSYRVTKDETHLTRGRANSLRLALSNQLGPDALTSDAMKETMALCVGCKACKRECPTGVDMAKMKVEYLHHYQAKHGWTFKDRLIAYLPRYAPVAGFLRGLLNLRDKLPGLALASEKALGFSAKRSLPVWKQAWSDRAEFASPNDVLNDGKDIILFADTFNRAFEGETLEAAMRLLKKMGYRLHHVMPLETARPLCCGRTFLSVGAIEQAREEATRTVDSLAPFVARGARIVGLEPSCLLTLRDEFFSLLPKEIVQPIADNSLLIEELLAADLREGKISLTFKSMKGRKAHVHGHCHQKSAGVMGSVEQCLAAIPDLSVTMIESSCCGMAGAFGYDAAHIDVSIKMAELSLLPAVRKADIADYIIADGTSCRHQIHDGTKREAMHIVHILNEAIS